MLVALAAAPVAFGSVHPQAYVLLLAVAIFTGLSSWARGHWARANGQSVPRVPARRLLLALHVVVLAQLLPLPPWLLARVSPGSFAFYDYVSLVPLTEWRPVSVSPADTARGLAFLIGMSLLYGTVFRDFRDPRWRRRLVLGLVWTGFLISLEALIQSGSGSRKIFGLWQPRWDWVVFGPYVNRNHFAGYVAMIIPLGLALAAESLDGLRQAWRSRRVGWLALGSASGLSFLRWIAIALSLIVGLVTSQSRGGFVAFLASGLALLLVVRLGWHALAAVLLVCVAGVTLVGVNDIVSAFAARGVQASRLELWGDSLRMVHDFPALGAGLNAFGTSYPRYQRIWPGVWFGEAHNEYLQSLLDVGIVGAGLVAALLWSLMAGAYRATRAGIIEGGLFCSLVAVCVHNLVDFNWQIPANAATFAALAGLAMLKRKGAELDPLGRHA